MEGTGSEERERRKRRGEGEMKTGRGGKERGGEEIVPRHF